jgi:hypothetical protein
MKKRKRKKKRTSGSRIFALAVLAVLCLLPAAAEKKKPVDSYGLVAGTVFREPGFALQGAEVTLEPNPETGQAPINIKKMKASTGARGEFAFRVPTAAMRYEVHAAARGYSPQDKNVSVEGERHVEVTFMLAKESK